jgi:hypothetical protein
MDRPPANLAMYTRIAEINKYFLAPKKKVSANIEMQEIRRKSFIYEKYQEPLTEGNYRERKKAGVTNLGIDMTYMQHCQFPMVTSPFLL